MAIEIPDYSNWALNADPRLADLLCVGAGFEDTEEHRLWRPQGGFSVIEEVVVVDVVTDRDGRADLPIDRLPFVRQVDEEQVPSHEQGLFLAIRHRKGKKSVSDDFPAREEQLRVLSLGPEISNMDTPPAKIVYGRHNDHPGETGYYIGAVHLGNLSMNGDSFIPKAPAFKFFPIALKE